MKYEIKRLSEIEDTQIDQAIAIFVDSFYYILRFFVKDKKILQVILKDAIDYNMVYVYIQDEVVLGLLALGNNKARPIKVKKEICEEIFGKSKGKKQYKKLDEQFSKILASNEQEGHIDIIAVKEENRGQGIATILIHYLLDNLDYESYVLEVLAKNEKALTLYKKLGFKQINKTTHIGLVLIGLGSILQLKLDLKGA